MWIPFELGHEKWGLRHTDNLYFTIKNTADNITTTGNYD